jgi:small subunit ribosomal protein S6
LKAKSKQKTSVNCYNKKKELLLHSILNKLFMNHYETVFILNPVLSDEQVKETVKKYEDFLISKGAKMINKENWGLKKLAYPIQHKKSGFYNLFEFQVDGEVIEPLELLFRREERMMRYLTVKLDKHAVAWAEKRVKRNKEKA